jgi:hypothetical protein
MLHNLKILILWKTNTTYLHIWYSWNNLVCFLLLSENKHKYNIFKYYEIHWNAEIFLLQALDVWNKLERQCCIQSWNFNIYVTCILDMLFAGYDNVSGTLSTQCLMYQILPYKCSVAHGITSKSSISNVDFFFSHYNDFFGPSNLCVTIFSTAMADTAWCSVTPVSTHTERPPPLSPGHLGFHTQRPPPLSPVSTHFVWTSMQVTGTTESSLCTL